jgi:hypothetical protein
MPMKPDLYTKIVFTIIALMLTMIAFRPLFSPQLVQAQGPRHLVTVPLSQYSIDNPPVGICSNGPNGCYAVTWGTNLGR